VKKKAIPIYLFSFFMIMPIIGVVPVLPVIRVEIGASYSQISIFVACLGIVRILFAFPSGFLADRFDRKKILLLSGFLSVSGLLILSFSRTIFHLIVSRILIGTGSIICTVTILVVLAQIASPNAKGAMMSMNNVVHGAGGIVSSALVGILTGWYNWRIPFFVIAGLILLSLITMAVAFSEERPNYKNAQELERMETKSSLRRNDRGGILDLGPVFAISLFVFFYRSSFRHTLIPFYGKDVLHVDVVALGFYISLMGCIAMVSIFIFGFLSDRYGRKAVLISGISFSTIAIMVLFLPRELNPLLVACIFVGAGAAINSMPNVLISDAAPPGSLGRMMGINRMFADSGYFLGAIIVGSLLDLFGFRVPLYVVAGLSVFSLALACFFIQNKRIKS
jgi:predicted MFS family arabinose efflux permease